MKRAALLVIVVVVLSVPAAWTIRNFRSFGHLGGPENHSPILTNSAAIQPWAEAVAKVKADRGEPMGGGAAVETPAELKHYSERYWFLATQIAEVAQHNIPTCQDYYDLAAMLQRGEMVSVPGVTETFVLYGVAERANDSEFTMGENGSSVGTYESLYTLAKNFGGRSYNLNDPVDRQMLKSNMLSSLRPAALKILEEVAAAYQRQFGRPLPVSSLVRPEQYQQALRKVNRNAVLIETPPQARLKNARRIEAIRERNANYHVFAFLNATRPSDDLIAAKLEQAMPPGMQATQEAEKVNRSGDRSV